MMCVLASCGLSSQADPGDDASTTGVAAGVAAGETPPLSEVTPLDDVRDWDGEVDAVAQTPVDPVADDPTPQLPW